MKESTGDKYVIKKLIIICVTIGLMSCATTPIDLSKEIDGSDYLKGIESQKYSGAIFDGDEESETDVEKMEQFEFYSGTGEFINKDAAKISETVVTNKGEITLNFEGNPLPAVISLILGDILQENYVIAPGVTGSVTFATVKPINKDQVLPILEMLLSWNNAALVYIEDRYHIMPRAQAIKGNLIPSYGQMDIRNGYTVMVVPLKYIAPAEMEKVLAPYTKEGSIVKADNARNLLFLSGTKRELSMYMKTINIFDVDWLEGMSTGIFTLERVEAATIVTEMEAIFGEGAENPLAGMFRFMPLERLNAVMVITPQEKYLHKAKEWILRLDRADSETSINLYVYNVKNIKADDLAGYLNDVFGGKRGGGSSRKNNSGTIAPGANGKEIGSSNNKPKNITRNRGSSNDEEISITPIEENNQILINANAQDYDSIMAAIARLDIEPLQVLLEAKIIEVTLNDSNESGVDWLFGSARDDDSSGDNSAASRRLFSFRDTESARVGSGGLSYVLTGVDVTATLSASEKASRATVLSTPSVLVLNNKEASINVGTRIPIQENSLNNNGNNSFRSVRYLQTGIKLTVTPRINPGGLVYIELSQEVSSPSAPDESGNRDIANRELTSEIAVQSGETVVMGGLIRETKGKGSFGVPKLHKIPILGNLFGSKTQSTERTELIVLITPTVIENPEQAKQLTKEYANQFKGLKPLRPKLNTNNNENK